MQEKVTVAKPGAFRLADFKSTRNDEKAEVSKEPVPLSVIRIAHVKDYVRLHEDTAAYWSGELDFVTVPIKGEKQGALHLISPGLAHLLPPNLVQHFGLALATKPYDEFFLCHVPTRGLENSTWLQSDALACEEAMGRWVMVNSLRTDGHERYGVTFAKDNDFVPVPNWPTESLEYLIGVTFGAGDHKSRCIIDEEHPGLVRLLGGKVEA
jgi:hypothetical protein